MAEREYIVLGGHAGRLRLLWVGAVMQQSGCMRTRKTDVLYQNIMGLEPA